VNLKSESQIPKVSHRVAKPRTATDAQCVGKNYRRLRKSLIFKRPPFETVEAGIGGSGAYLAEYASL
jgi:hypothetical protein